MHDENCHLIELKVRHNRFALRTRRNVVSNHRIANSK